MSSDTISGDVGGASPAGQALGSSEDQATPGGLPLSGSEEGSGEGSTSQNHDYETLYKDIQSKYDSQEHWLGAMKQVNPKTGKSYMDDFGTSATALKYAQVGALALGNPVIQQQLQKLATTGTLEGEEDPVQEDDPFEPESVKELRNEVTQLRGALQQQSAGQNVVAQAQGVQRLKDHAVSFLTSEPDLTDEERGKFQEAILSQFDQIAARAPGTVLGMDQHTFGMVARDVLERNVVTQKDLAKRAIQRESQNLGTLGTDPGVQFSTNGAEPGVQKTGAALRNVDTRKLAREALADAFRQTGR